MQADLQVEGEDQEEPGHGAGEAQLDDAAGGEAPVGEQVHRCQRRTVPAHPAPLVDHEGGEHQRGRREHGPDPAGPALLPPLDQREDEQEQAGGDEQQAGDVQAQRVGGAGVGHEAPGGDEQGEADGDVDDEDAAPANGEGVDGDEPAAEEGAGDGGHAGDGADDAEDRGAFPGLVEGLHGGQDLGDHEGGEGALDDAGRHQGVAVLGEGRGERGEGEAGHAGEEHGLAADDVAQASAGDQDDGEGEGVAADDPFEVAGRRVDVLLDGGQADVDDGGVQQVHEGRDDQDDHREGAAAVDGRGGFCGRRRRRRRGRGRGRGGAVLGHGSWVLFDA